MARLLDELKRRNVIRVAVAYAVASWVLLQVADLVVDNIDAPVWVMQVFMLFLALGFPLVVMFSWAFELTPEGIKRESEVDRSESVTRQTAHNLNRLTIGLLMLVVVIIGVDRLLLQPDRQPADAMQLANAPVEQAEKSIAVLAFDDLSPAGDQAYFAEGISEELLNVLAQIPDLKVAGRTSSFAFKDQDRDLREIGEILDVAHILEGSVRTSGNRVRVTAQLVKADDGFHLFSKNYDRELTDIFAVQDDIAREIGNALRSAILGDASNASVEALTPTSTEAYRRYLHARQWIHTRDRSLMEQASAMLEEALEIDPDYPPALAQKALVTLLLSDSPGAYGEMPFAQAHRIARPLLGRALELDPNLAEGHAILGLLLGQASVEPSQAAIASLRRALEINPTMANANNWLATEISDSASMGASLELYEKVVQHDPLYAPAFNNLTFQYMQTRGLDKADTLIRRVQRITGDSPSVRFARGALAMASGDLSTAVRELHEAYDFNNSASVVQLWYSTALSFVGDLEYAASVARDTDRLVMLELSGRHDEALAIFESLNTELLDEGQLWGVSDWFLQRGEAGQLIEFLEPLYGNADSWLGSLPKPDQLWGVGSHTNLAAALLAAGREEEAQKLLYGAKEMLEVQRQSGADNLFFWYSAAQLEALLGNRQGMLAALRNAIDTGFVNVLGCGSVIFDPYRSDRRFIELENEMIRRANEEKKELDSLTT